MRRMTLLLVNVLLIVNTGFQEAHTQAGNQEQKPAAVTLRSTEVLVDAVVVDRKNHLVSDLTTKDFQIYEDGVPQQITSFRVVRGGTEESERERASSAPSPTSQERATERAKNDVGAAGAVVEPPNLIVVLLDYSTTEFRNKKLVQDASIKYVEERMRTNDLMAVFVLGGELRVASEFTNDKPALVAALMRSDLTGTSLAGDRADMSEVIEKGDSAANQLSTQPISGGAGGSAAGSSEAAKLIAQRYAEMLISMRASLDRRQTLGVLSAIRAIAIGLRRIEGRKTLLLFSQGFVVAPGVEDDLRVTTGIANRSNLAVYCIESQGLETRELIADVVPRDPLTEAAAQGQSRRIKTFGGESGFDRSLQVGEGIGDRALAYIANSTGGSLIRDTNDLARGLFRIDQEMREHYLLAYHPNDDALDGRFRQIKVAVNRPDLTVRARSGYYAMPAGYEILTPPEYQLMQTAEKAESESKKLPLFMRASAFLESGREYRIPIAVEIPYTSVRFSTDKDKHSAELLFFGIVRDGPGGVVTRFGNPVQLTLTDAEYNRLKVGTISFTNEVRLPSDDDYSVLVFAKDLASGLLSEARQNLDLRMSMNAFGLSSVLLANGRELFRASDKSDDFLTVQGIKLVPSAACQFRNNDNLVFYFDVYNPQVDPERKKTDISVKLAFVRDGKTVNAGLPDFHLSDLPTGSTRRVTLCRFLHLNGLQPGRYSIIVDVKDEVGKETARREATFTIL